MAEAVLLENLLVESPLTASTRMAMMRVAPSIVSVVTSDLPESMCLWHGSKFIKADDTEIVFEATGVIVECSAVGDGRYCAVVIVPATLLVRDDDTEPQDVKVEVRLFNGNLYQGKVFAYDFHYNLAAVRIKSDAPLQTAILRGLSDVSYLGWDKTPQLRPHSNLHNISHGADIIALKRCYLPPFHLDLVSCAFSTLDETSASFRKLDCKELYFVKGANIKFMSGAPLINCSGEVIGIMFYNFSFLPSNFVSRWWNHYKSHRELRRPWLGLETVNLHAVSFTFLEHLIHKFPNTDRGVVITKVEKDSPAYRSGVRLKDVIIKCCGKLVQSNLEFFEYIWDNAGQPMELTVLRPKNGRQLNLSMTTGELTSDKFNEWPLPDWWTRKTSN